MKTLERRDKQSLGVLLVAIPARVMFDVRQTTKILSKIAGLWLQFILCPVC
jgi:hypothetical protein